MPPDLRTIQDFAIALLLGLLIGIEREKRKHESNDLGIGGIRTFVLFSEIGAIAGLLARELDTTWIFSISILAVSALVISGYVISSRARPEHVGITTETAAIAVVLMGGMTTLGHRELAVGLAVITAAALAYKRPLHGLVERLGWDDVFAGLRLLIATFVVLPLLPDRTLDPWQAINPRSLWLLVLLISGLSLVGYVATRWFGQKKGTAVTALTGGLVSSTSVTLSFARESKLERGRIVAATLAGGIVLAWTVMFARVVVLVLVIEPPLAAALALPLAAMGITAGVLAWIDFRRGAGASRAEEVALRNPFSLTSAAKVALLIALVQVLAKIAQEHSTDTGMYAVAALAGLTDVDAITLSMANLAKTGDAQLAARAIVLATMANTLLKLGLVVVLGDAGLRRPVLYAAAAVIAVGAIAIPFL